MRSEAAFADTLEGLVADRRHDLRTAEGDMAKQAIRKRYASVLAAWSPRNRVLVRTVVLDADGEPCQTEGAGADALAADWGLMFESAGGVDIAAMHRLRNGVVGATASPPRAPLDDLRRVLARCPRSASGADGIAYARWACVGEAGLHAVYDAYVSVLEGRGSPGFQ